MRSPRKGRRLPICVSKSAFLLLTSLLLAGCGDSEEDLADLASTVPASVTDAATAPSAPTEAKLTEPAKAQPADNPSSRPEAAEPEGSGKRVEDNPDSGWFEGIMAGSDGTRSGPEENVTSITNETLGEGEFAKRQPVQNTSAEPQRLVWEPPLTREDGSKLFPGDIGGFRIYYRNSSGESYKKLELTGDQTSLSLDRFDPGYYQFAISTVDSQGLESARSEPVSVELNL